MARTSRKKRARNRILTDDEIRAIWKYTASDTFGVLVRFLLLTAARRDEARVMTWQEIKDTDWHLPATRNKTNQELVRPLSKAVRDLLDTLPRNWPMCSLAEMADQQPRQAQGRARYGQRRWRTAIHDLRRTARSLMSRAGVSSDHAELCLGHVRPSIRATCDGRGYKEEKRAAFEKLAALVADIIGA